MQAALLAGALLAGLAWAETEPGYVLLASEQMTLSVSAPVVHPKGPWTEGKTFTEEDAGIPVDVAPLWTVSARTATSGGNATDHNWSAVLHLAKKASVGRPWWTIEEPLNLTVVEGFANLTFNASALVARVLALDEAAKAPGELDVSVLFTHAANLSFANRTEPSTRTGVLVMKPLENLVLVAVSGDSTVFDDTTPKEPPWIAFGLAAALVATEGGRLLAGRGRPAWERLRPRRVVHVEDLKVPAGTPTTDLETVLAIARDTDALLLVDAKRERVLLRGEIDLLAPLPPAGARPRPSPTSAIRVRTAPRRPATTVLVRDGMPVPHRVPETTAPAVAAAPDGEAERAVGRAAAGAGHAGERQAPAGAGAAAEDAPTPPGRYAPLLKAAKGRGAGRWPRAARKRVGAPPSAADVKPSVPQSASIAAAGRATAVPGGGQTASEPKPPVPTAPPTAPPDPAVPPPLPSPSEPRPEPADTKGPGGG